jgi:Xaa-Pro aminopeptidase
VDESCEPIKKKRSKDKIVVSTKSSFFNATSWKRRKREMTLKDPIDLGHGYEGREYNYPYDNPGLGLMAVDWEERIDVKRLRSERMVKAKEAFRESGADALFLFRIENVKYLSGYRSHDWPMIMLGLASALLVGEEDPFVFTMDLDNVKLRMPWIADRSFLQPGGGLETEDGVRTWMAMARDLMAQAGTKNPSVIGVDAWNHPLVELLPQLFPKTKFVDGQKIMLEARKIKTIDEINCLKLAYSVTAAGMGNAIEFIRPGRKECEVLAEAWRTFTALGSEWTQCANIVCSGPYTAPYRRFTSDRLIEYGDLVIIDIGARLNGYYGDFTRTWVCGHTARPTNQQIRLHRAVFEAMRAAERAIKPGARTTDVYDAAGPTVLGGVLGHGIGLAAAEPPYIKSEQVVPREKAEVLKPGMVFSIEPYMGEPGIGGIRLEDNIVVTETGCDLISRFPFDHRLLE